MSLNLKIHVVRSRASFGAIIGLYLVLVCIGCAHFRYPVILPESKPTLEALAKERAEEYFIQARDYDRRGLPQLAVQFYQKAYQLQPDSEIIRELLAEKYMELEQYAQALVVLKGDTPIDSLSKEYRRTVASLYVKLGQIPKAVATLESMKDLSPEEHFSLGFLYESINMLDKASGQYRFYYESEQGHLAMVGEKLAQVYLRIGRLDSAESLYVDMEKEFEQSRSDAIKGLGMVSLARGDTTRALDYLQTSVVTDSTNFDAMRVCAQIAIQRNDHEQAIQYYERLYAGDTSFSRMYGKTLALLYYYAKQYDKAQELLTRFLANDIDDFELHFYLGLVFAAQKNDELAGLELEKTITLQPDISDAWQQLCYLELRRNNPEKALVFAKKYIEQFPQSPVAFHTLGYVYSANKDYLNAITSLKSSVGFDSTNATTWFDLGTAFERDSQFENAADAFRNALRLNPKDHAAANYLGYMWADMGVKLDSAKTLLEFALSLEPNHSAYLDSYAWILFKVGEFKKARTHIEMALATGSSDPILYSHLGDILASLHDTAGAIEAFRKSISLGCDERERLEEKIRLLEGRSPVPFSHDALDPDK